MKLTTVLFMTSAIFFSSASTWAEEKKDAEEHATHHPAAIAEQVAQPDAHQKDSGAMMAGMQDHMRSMQETMQKIHAATSDAERKKLMDDHMKQMQKHMDMMKGMGSNGAGMGGMSAMKDKGDKQGMGMMEGGMKCSMMDRMDMMQMMMEQMMQHMAMQQSQGKK